MVRQAPVLSPATTEALSMPTPDSRFKAVRRPGDVNPCECDVCHCDKRVNGMRRVCTFCQADTHRDIDATRGAR